MLQNKNKTKIIAQWNLFIFVLVLNVWLAMYPVWIFARKPSGSSRTLPVWCGWSTTTRQDCVLEKASQVSLCCFMVCTNGRSLKCQNRLEILSGLSQTKTNGVEWYCRSRSMDGRFFWSSFLYLLAQISLLVHLISFILAMLNHFLGVFLRFY